MENSNRYAVLEVEEGKEMDDNQNEEMVEKEKNKQ